MLGMTLENALLDILLGRHQRSIHGPIPEGWSQVNLGVSRSGDWFWFETEKRWQEVSRNDGTLGIHVSFFPAVIRKGKS